MYYKGYPEIFKFANDFLIFEWKRNELFIKILNKNNWTKLNKTVNFLNKHFNLLERIYLNLEKT